MNTIKLETEDCLLNEDELTCNNSCFICLEQITIINQEKSTLLLNLFLNCLKISKVKSVICEKCGENLTKFLQLWNTLEKARLEMDYLLGIFQSKILNSNGDPTSVGFSVRDSVAKRCQENISSPKPEILLQKIDPSKPTKYQSNAPDCSDLNNDSILSDSEDASGSPATPVVRVALDFKVEENMKEDFEEAQNKEESSKCPKCPKILSNKSKLRIHINTVHLLQKPYKCSNCERSFSQPRDLKRHNDSVHLRLKPFKCSTCFKDFRCPSTLNGHIKTVHLRIKPYKCDKCDRAYAHLKDLKRHKDNRHEGQDQGSNLKTFPCKLCDKGFGHAQLLKAHVNRVHTDLKIPCDICKKKFKTLGTLKRHLLVIHENKRFHCQAPGCDVSFRYRSALAEHYKLLHPNFTMLLQGKPTRGAGYLRTFEDGECLLECERCESKFKSVDQVMEHIKREHAEEFFCDHCGYSTDNKGHFERHVKSVHKRRHEVDNEESGGVRDSVKSESEAMNEEPEFILP